MFAQVLTEYGGLNVLQYQEVDTPVPGPGEVRVRVAFAALNPIEWKIRSGAFHHMVPVTFPAILGNEMSGVIDQAAKGSEFQVGDRVTGFTRAGSDAEYVVTTPDRIAKVPAGLSLRQAATIPQGVETARLITTAGPTADVLPAQLAILEALPLVAGAILMHPSCQWEHADRRGRPAQGGVQAAGPSAKDVPGSGRAEAQDPRRPPPGRRPGFLLTGRAAP